MKLYFCNQDVMPNENEYFILTMNPDGTDVPDMVTPVYRKGQVVTWTQAKRIQELHGKGFTSMVEIPSVFGVTRIIRHVDDLGCVHSHQYYIPAL